MVERRNGAASAAQDYDAVAKGLHWLIVLLLIAQFAAAWTMPHIGRNTKPETLINLHLSFGFTILIVVVLRLLWRLGHRVAPPTDVPAWQRLAAQASHALLYLLLLVLPLLGWIGASMRGWSIDYFGIATVPQIVATNPALAGRMGDIHTLFAYILLGLIGLHVLATLYHLLWLRDRVFWRMLPGSR